MVPERLILASASPQRRAILAQLGVDFEVRPTDVEELTAGEPAEVVAENARRKALAGAAGAGARALGADTIVTLDDDVIGKPADAGEARAMLRRLAGRTHEVLGGVAIARDGAIVAQGVAVTRVGFRELDDAAIDRYVATGEWRGRAGGYAIQERGALLVAKIDGDYLNVVGLPVALLADLAPDLLAGG